MSPAAPADIRPTPWRPPMALGRRRVAAGSVRKLKCRFPFICGRARTSSDVGFSKDGLQLGISAKRAAILILPIALAACAGSDDSRSISFMGGGGANAAQPFPANYRSELLAFMRTYLNNPVGVHDAALAEPLQREVSGRTRYVSCLRYSPRESDGSYREARERAILYVNGRLDRMIENAAEVCAGAVYAPFPELEKLAR
jgi:hypothetical protein